MSFRSVGALPKCLQGRLAPPRRFWNCGCAFHQLRAHSLAQAVDGEGRKYSDSNHHDSSSWEASRDKKTVFRKSWRPNYRDYTSAIPTHTATNLTPSISKAESSLVSNPSIQDNRASEDRVAARQYKARSNPGKSRTFRDEESSLKNEKEESGNRYDEWERLHDKFCKAKEEHFARTGGTNRSELSEAFYHEKRFAEQFIGDSSHEEVGRVEFACKFLALSAAERNKILPSLLIGSLVTSAAQTLFVLANVWYIPCPFLVRMNCLRHLRMLYPRNIRRDKKLEQLYLDMMEKLRSPEAWPANKIPSVLLHNLLIWSTPEQCQRIIRDLEEKYPVTDTQTKIAIIDHFLRIGDREQAFEWFKQLPQEQLLQTSGITIDLRDRLLKLDFVEETEISANFKYLPQILALGVAPDAELHNIVIQNAISSELPEVAWDVFQYMQSSQFQPNARSHLLLLRNSVQRKDLKRVDEIMTAIHNRNDLVSDQYLVAYSMNIIRVISTYERKLGPMEAQDHIMALYDRAYDREPLIKLGLVEPLKTSSSALPQPSPTLLSFTVWTFILIQQREAPVRRLWEWFRHLIANGDESFLQAAHYDIIYNGFILYYSRHSTTLVRALDVLQYMLDVNLRVPTARTWSMLLCGFLKHGQTKQADKVLALMRHRGYDVQRVIDEHGSYVPDGHNLRSMVDAIDAKLDEKSIPEEVQQLLGESPSIKIEASSDASHFVGDRL